MASQNCNIYSRAAEELSEMTNIYFKGNYYSADSGNHSWIHVHVCVCVCVCVLQ